MMEAARYGQTPAGVWSARLYSKAGAAAEALPPAATPIFAPVLAWPQSATPLFAQIRGLPTTLPQPL